MHTLIHSYVPLHSSLYPQTDGNVLVYTYIYIYIYINIRVIRAYIFSGGKRLLRCMRIHSHIDPSTGIMCTFI